MNVLSLHTHTAVGLEHILERSLLWSNLTILFWMSWCSERVTNSWQLLVYIKDWKTTDWKADSSSPENDLINTPSLPLSLSFFPPFLTHFFKGKQAHLPLLGSRTLLTFKHQMTTWASPIGQSGTFSFFRLFHAASAVLHAEYQDNHGSSVCPLMHCTSTDKVDSP